MFMIGECYFFTDQYPEANAQFDKLAQEYKNSRYVDRAVHRQFAIARYWEQKHRADPHWAITPNFSDGTAHVFDTAGHALRTYNNIRMHDPTGPLADDAVMATANHYFLKGSFSDADYYYTRLRKDYPESEHQFEAHLLGLQAKIRTYQGADYDSQPLVDAEKLTKQLLSQFPAKVREHRDRIEKLQAQVNASLAVRDYETAEYYAGREQYGAARYYFQQVANNYPGTKLAQASLAKMGEFQGEPDTPPQRFAWLVDAFPGDDDPLDHRPNEPVTEKISRLAKLVTGTATE